MGWLHAGHASLIERARADSGTVVVSIFVNPRQFGESADFERYPRDEARDLAACEAAGVDLVFAPPVEEVYPAGFDTTVRVGAIAGPLEGTARPGHFDGVATVVAILFALVGAERAYFGLKDYQQVAVIRRMALDLALPTEVVACPTVREPDGLAMSSRNAYLSAENRKAAPALHRVLKDSAKRINAGDPIEAALDDGRKAIARAGFALDYLEARHADTLAPVTSRKDGPIRILVAAKIGQTRLIDNIGV
jgi:pantoate--beta-alanine ligase